MAAFVTTWNEGGKNRCKKNHNKTGAYAINKQTLKVNSRKSSFNTSSWSEQIWNILVLQLHHLQDSFLLVFKPRLTNEVTAWYNSLFLSVSNVWKDVLLIDLDISSWILASWDCFYQWAITLVLGSLQWWLLSLSHDRTLRMFYCIWP